MNGAYGASQRCLAGAILCCTSIPPEQREDLGNIGLQMGATIKHDLTSDVTHLIVGNINSAKYRYVAKLREDVKVLTPEWLYAVNTVWMEGGDVDVAALEKEYRSPTFYGLKICLTGFDNPDQRKYIQDTAMQNGAEYHGDLTKSVTHLVTATPSGKKYEHAVNWRMKIVSWEWFEQSVQRGMALDESYFHPTMPVEERGKGAWDRRQSLTPTLGKRTRDAEGSQLANPLRRKLRRSASSKVDSQSEALWAGITASGFERQQNDEDDWTEGASAKTSLPRTNAPTTDTDRTAGMYDSAHPEGPVSLSPTDTSDRYGGIFQGRAVLAYGFDVEKMNILQQHLASNGAITVHNAAELEKFSSDDLRRGYLVIPHDIKSDLTSLPEPAGAMSLVTNWWVERCLHAKCLVDPTDHVLCRPFDNLSISGFEGLTINSTAFTGIELLQVTKAVALMGANYDEFLTTKTSVMVCNTRKPNPDKFKFVTDKHIPAVHATWLWECLRTGELQPFDDYLLNTITSQPQRPRQTTEKPSPEVPTAPLSKEDSIKLRKEAQTSKQPSRAQSRTGRPRTLDLTLSANPGTNSPASSTHPNTISNGPFVDDDDDSDDDDNEPPIAPNDGPASLPLQDINPSVNSPRRPSVSSDASSTKPSLKSKSSSTTRSNSTSDCKPAPAPRTSKLTKRHPTDSIIPLPTEPPAQEEKQKPPEIDHVSMMSNILAQRKAAAEASSLNKTEGGKKRRQLGRASSTRSNPSTSETPFSRASSIVEEGESGGRKREEEDVRCEILKRHC